MLFLEAVGGSNMDTVRNTYKIYDNSELGEVNISDDVLAVISAMAALEVDGVVGMAGNITSEIVEKLGVKKLAKGVRIDVSENNVMIDVSIVLRMNENIINISKKVQDKIKTTVENMTGLSVANINVNISNVLAK